MPGVPRRCCLVFVLALGFYILPRHGRRSARDPRFRRCCSPAVERSSTGAYARTLSPCCWDGLGHHRPCYRPARHRQCSDNNTIRPTRFRRRGGRLILLFLASPSFVLVVCRFSSATTAPSRRQPSIALYSAYFGSEDWLRPTWWLKLGSPPRPSVLATLLGNAGRRGPRPPAAGAPHRVGRLILSR